VLEVAENNRDALAFYRHRNFYKLDAAIFMAQKISVEPDLLPPRMLKQREPRERDEDDGEGIAVLDVPEPQSGPPPAQRFKGRAASELARPKRKRKKKRVEED
jgi:hypothetical protein